MCPLKYNFITIFLNLNKSLPFILDDWDKKKKKNTVEMLINYTPRKGETLIREHGGYRINKNSS